jgi:SpoVK/Ycf46/Vps4 family AAA+-type ATPase
MTIAQRSLVRDDVRFREQIRMQWGIGKHDSPNAMTIAFSGPAGCGKTLAARVLAHQLRLDLYQVDLEEARLRWNAGDRLSIDWLFRRAVASPVLLQLRDRAGALSASTDGAGGPWSLAASLIRRLQDRDGFVIVTARSLTEREAGPWPFDHVVTFPFPDGGARNALWRLAFPPEMPVFQDIDFTALASHPLSGDSIRRAVRNAALFAARDGRAVSMADCVRAIQLAGGDSRTSVRPTT